MPLYPAVPFPATPAAAPDGWPAGLAGAGIVAVRVADLRSPLRRPLRERERTVLTAERAGKIRTGDMAVFLKPVAVAPAPRPPACPPPSPPPATRTPLATWADDASPPTGTGTAPARPRLARHSPSPDGTPSPARHPPPSPSAARSPPEAWTPTAASPHQHRPPSRGTGRRPGATSGLQPCTRTRSPPVANPSRSQIRRPNPETAHLDGIGLHPPWVVQVEVPEPYRSHCLRSQMGMQGCCLAERCTGLNRPKVLAGIALFAASWLDEMRTRHAH